MRLADELNLQAQAFRPIAIHILDVANFDEDVLWRISFTELRNGRERGYCASINYGFERNTVRIFFGEVRGSDQFFIWTWDDQKELERPSTNDSTDGSYKSRFTCGEFQFHLAAKEFLRIVLAAKKLLTPEKGEALVPVESGAKRTGVGGIPKGRVASVYGREEPKR